MLRSIMMYFGVLFISIMFSSSLMAAPYTAGNALSFNTSKYVTVPNSESLNPTQFTLECWVKFNPSFELISQHNLIDKDGEEAPTGYYRLIEYQLSGTRMYFEIRDRNAEPMAENTYVECDSLKIISDAWYHVAGTYDGDWMRLYVNGNLVSQKQVGAIVIGNVQPLKIGMVSGNMDEVRIWSAARTQDEINSNMYREIDSAPGLVSTWHFNEGSGQVVSDATGSNSGYLGSTPDADINDPQWVQSTAPVTKDILLISPNGGEEWLPGSAQTIRWFAFNTIAINIDYSSNAGATWKSVANQVDASLGSFPWTVPSESTLMGLIRITDTSNPERTDLSDSLFTISQAYIQLLSPNGGEKWETETTHNIMWKSLGVNKINIDFSTDDGANWIPVTSEVNALADSFAWKVPFTPTSQGRVRIRNADSSLVSASESHFTIVQSSLVLLQPKGGDILEPGTVEDITWSSTPGVDSVKVEYSPDGGTNWQFLIITGALDLYHWTVPPQETNKGLIKVSWVEHPIVTIPVNGTFSIKTEVPIEWTYYSSSLPVKVLSVNSDMIWYLTDTNILRLNRKTAVIDTIIPPSDFLINKVTAIVFDSVGTAWFGIVSDSLGNTYQGALWSFDDVHWKYYSAPYLTGLGIDSNDVKYVSTRHVEGIMSRVEYYSLLSFNGTSWKTISSGSIGNYMYSDYTSVLIVDNHRHSVWVADETGVEEIIIDTGQNGIIGVTLGENWSRNPLQGVLDTFGNFWFSSSHGYFSTYIDGNWIHYTPDNSPLPWRNTFSNFGVAITQDNVKWFGGPGGLVRYDDSNWKTIPVSADSAKNSIWSLKVDADGNIWGITPDGIARYGYIPGPSSVNEKTEEPIAFVTITNYPNPFNPSTTIEFTLPASGKANLVVYDIMGRKVRELIYGQVSAGMRSTLWDGRDDSGRSVSSGVYIARLTMGKSFAIKKMLMIK
jgi:hypothetical protein